MSPFPFFLEDEPPDRESITLTDEEGRSLLCQVERTFCQGDTTYYLLMPVDAPITLVAWEETPQEFDATWVEDSEEIARIFPDAKAVLAERNLTLHYAAYTLTVGGELPEPQENEILTLEIETETGTLESEEFQFLANFYHDHQEYEIYTPLDPLLLFAKQTIDGRPELLSSDEIKKLQPVIEEWIIEEEYDNEE